MVDNEHNTTAEPQHRGAVSIAVLNALMVVLVAAVSIVFLQAVRETNAAYRELENASDSYIACERAASQMQEGSNYLTLQVRRFAATRQTQYVDNYFYEADVNKRREAALATLESLEEGESAYLEEALKYSTDLMDLEFYIMRLVIDACGYEIRDTWGLVAAVELSADDAALSAQEKLNKANSLAFSEEYMNYVDKIEGNVSDCKLSLIENIERFQEQSSSNLNDLLFRQQLFTVLLFVVVIAMIMSIVMLVLWPLRSFTGRIQKGEALPEIGANELRYLSGAYNMMYEENLKNHDALRRKAEHDHLTGLYNRSVFERLLAVYSNEPYALLLIDADHFKDVNDTLGHDGGDAVLRKISDALSNTFRATDNPCRIGGDEFAVIMTEVDASFKSVVEAKVKSVVDALADTSDGLPAMTLSIGIAFNDGTKSGEVMFKCADQALYEVKERGRNGYRFYEG